MFHTVTHVLGRYDHTQEDPNSQPATSIIIRKQFTNLSSNDGATAAHDGAERASAGEGEAEAL